MLQVACRAEARSIGRHQPACELCAPARQPRSQLRFERRLVGVTGVEPVTLRLSSACSNQLSYTPYAAVAALPQFQISNLRFEIKAGGAEEIRTPDL